MRTGFTKLPAENVSARLRTLSDFLRLHFTSLWEGGGAQHYFHETCKLVVSSVYLLYISRG